MSRDTRLVSLRETHENVIQSIQNFEVRIATVNMKFCLRIALLFLLVTGTITQGRPLLENIIGNYRSCNDSIMVVVCIFFWSCLLR